MKTVLVIWCVFALSEALSLVIPAKDYLRKLDQGEEHPVQFVDLVSDEEQLLSKRVGRQRQYYSNKGLPTQSKSYEFFIPLFNLQKHNLTDYGGFNAKGYNNYYPSNPGYNRKIYKSQRRRKFGGIGSAIIV